MCARRHSIITSFVATILKTGSDGVTADTVEAAARALRAGEAIALPTETVYGLAANAFDSHAIERIFNIKGRPAHNPVIVHVASLAMARACARSWPREADLLAQAFWPGPLTLVVPRGSRIPDAVAAGGETVGLRWPRHPIFQEIIEACGFPLAAPSANRSGQVSPTTAEHVQRSLGERINWIVDGGPAEIGIESTVLDLSVTPPRLLRPGMIDAASLKSVIGPLDSTAPPEGVLRSPGLLLKHYSPRARLLVWSRTSLASLANELEQSQMDACQVHFLCLNPSKPPFPFGRVTVMPHEPAAYAKALYAEWHRSDELGAQLIVMESVPDRPEWAGVQDRLRRAAA